MNWLIFIHSYLIRNSLRRWVEQPLSLISKVTVAALLGIFTTLVLAGIRGLGNELDKRLLDKEILTAYIAETYSASEALEEISSIGPSSSFWNDIVGKQTVVYQSTATADTGQQEGLPILAVDSIEAEGLVDDFYLLSNQRPKDQVVGFSIGAFASEALVKPIPEKFQFALLSRPGILADFDRLSPLFARGYTKTVVLEAQNISQLERVQDMTDTLRIVEGRRMFLRSNLPILREIEKIRKLQSTALVVVTFLSSAILGLIFGSLAWLEFREERYVLALIRSFGVRSSSLVVHSLLENCFIAVSGVIAGVSGLHFLSNALLKTNSSMLVLMPDIDLLTSDTYVLILGSLIGGLLAAIPVFVGLRKPLGLVLT
ncbi:FtsX-like permease family protein [Luteolibacter sp. AS25]|uniref:FtsX-like permease family protein n=1 Tax=Luteolibacter sp. AS25 TaxID=3135776 RepID=UPI00398BA989